MLVLEQQKNASVFGKHQANPDRFNQEDDACVPKSGNVSFSNKSYIIMRYVNIMLLVFNVLREFKVFQPPSAVDAQAVLKKILLQKSASTNATHFHCTVQR